jgi:mxaA protein
MRLFAVTLAAILLCSMPEVKAAPALATVEQPRAFGRTVGDVLTQRILLQSGNEDLSTVTMPSTGRIGVWLERRNPRIETDAEHRRWMVIDYQITNAPQTLTTITLPALSLATLEVPEWPVSVSPLTPQTAFGTGDLQEFRPDRRAPLPATAPLRRQMMWALGLLALTLLAWFGWWQWRNAREAARLPFSKAYNEMQRARKSGTDNPNTTDAQTHAWLCLHRALNETAGQVVHAGTLPDLFARAPHLQPLQPQLERFYQHSGERFFASGSVDPRIDPGFPLLDLCRALYRAERRQQR